MFISFFFLSFLWQLVKSGFSQVLSWIWSFMSTRMCRSLMTPLMSLIWLLFPVWVKIQKTIWQCSGLCVRQHSFGWVVRTPPSSKTSWTSRWPLGTLGSDQVKCPNAEPGAELWDSVFTSVCQNYEKGELTHIDLYNWGQKSQSPEIS